MFTGGATSATFCMKLQYVDSNGDPQYDTIDMKTAVANQWVHLYNPEYTIPADATDMYVYVETAEGTMDFYVDEAIGAVAGTVITGPGETKFKLGDVNFDGIIDSIDLVVAMRGILQEGFSSEAAERAADVNQDGEVNSNDMALLSRYILKIIDRFPV